MSDNYDAQALWLKAKLFLNHAMDDGDERSFDERALWAALALELLAKSALSRHSPLLIASPTEDGGNLLAASGLTPPQPKFTSVPAKTLMSRCAKAFVPFSEAEAGKITIARNAYLHGGAAQFAPLPPEAWWPKFWAQALILIQAQDKTLEDMVGESRVDEVESHLAQNKKNVESRTQALIERAKQRLAQFRSGNLPARLADEFAKDRDLSSGFWGKYGTATCPACGDSDAAVEGDNIVASKVEGAWGGSDLDDYVTWVELTVSSSHFSCSTCRLVLPDYEFIEAAGVDTEFITTDDDVAEYYGPEYGND
ncbi:hypothetical protein [Nocardia sp. NPDC003183]